MKPPPLAPEPNELRKMRLVAIAAATAGFLAVAFVTLAVIERHVDWLLCGVVALVTAGGLGMAWVDLGFHVQSLVRARLVAWIDEASDDEALSEAFDTGQILVHSRPDEPTYWMEKLVLRSERLRRLVDLHAPDQIIDEERRLVREAMAKLDPAVALSIVGAAADDVDESDPS